MNKLRTRHLSRLLLSFRQSSFSARAAGVIPLEDTLEAKYAMLANHSESPSLNVEDIDMLR